MKAAVLYFSEKGGKLAQNIAEAIKTEYEVQVTAPGKELSRVTGELFEEAEAIIFVGACGIAVRAIAPYVKSKTTDPAVIAADDMGKHVISLLSGHIGGANRLTEIIAGQIGADPVITTATDVNRRFSVDEWAAKNGFAIDSMKAAKDFAAAILKDNLPVYSEIPADKLHSSLYEGSEGQIGLSVSYTKVKPFEETMLIVPKRIHLGIGCRRGTSAEQIEEFVLKVMAENNLDMRAVCDVSSIDLKSDEEGLLKFCEMHGVTPRFYTADELNAAPGEYKSSAFVSSTVGTDNVCERSAVLSAGPEYKVLVHKTAGGGVTVAAALDIRRLSIE